MKKNVIAMVLIGIFLLSSFTITSAFGEYSISIVTSGTTLYVDDDNCPGPGDGTPENPFCKIQDAIDNASNGDTIFVYSGTYYENIVINKNSINIFGENKDNTIIDGGGTGNVIYVYGDEVNISDFAIQNGDFGIWLYDSSNINITGNTIKDNKYVGINMLRLSNNKITNNNIKNNEFGTYLYYSSNNNIAGNIITDNNKDGIYLSISSNNNITDNNTIMNNKENGIVLYYSPNNNIAGNIITDNNKDGIWLFRSPNNNITVNTIMDNIRYGILLQNSSYNINAGNTISNNWQGIVLYYSPNNNITGNNNITDNNGYGILLRYSSENIIDDNMIIKNIIGIFLQDSSDNNAIQHNFFKKNILSALFFDCTKNFWNNNYWDRSRILPKLIYGYRTFHNIAIPWINVDRNPSRITTDLKSYIAENRLYQKNSYKAFPYIFKEYFLCDSSYLYDNLLNEYQNNDDRLYTQLIEVDFKKSRFESIQSTQKPDFENGTTWYVDDDGGGDFTKIQDAIDNASDGDTIFVYNGFYQENIRINKSIILQGQNRNTTAIDGGGIADVINIDVKWVKIHGFTIQNGDFGIWLYDSSNINITGNTIKDNKYVGIHLSISLNNNIIDNTVVNNKYGIVLYYSPNNTITSNNTIIDNKWHGIEIQHSSNINITGNTISNSWHSIWLSTLSNSTISKNNIKNNEFGIYLYISSNNTIIGNTIIDNNLRSIELGHSSNNRITGNYIADSNWHGIELQHSSNNTIIGNNIRNNEIGIHLFGSNHNTIKENNLIKNKDKHAFFEFSRYNIWSSNYWDDWILQVPRPIPGKRSLSHNDSPNINHLSFYCINFDLCPAKKPYDIPI